MIIFYRALNILFDIIEIFIVIRIFLSFLPTGSNTFSRFIYDMTEPILYPCRKLLSKLGLDTGFFDFSPIIAVLFLRLIYYIVGRIILLMY